MAPEGNKPHWKIQREKKKGKKSKDQGRTSKTNRSQEAKRFSTVKFPKKAEVKTANQRALAPELRAGGPSRAELASKQAIMKKQQQQNDATATSQDAAAPSTSNSDGSFDPIPQDPMFAVVKNSKYWPPVPLATLLKGRISTGDFETTPSGELSEDAVDQAVMDKFDRQDDEKQRRKQIEKLVKKQKKENPGELIHPRGKVVNTKVKLDDSSSSSSDDE